MNTKHKPATPLPWAFVDNGMQIIAREAPAQIRPVSVAHATRAHANYNTNNALVDVAYIAHAANAYPKLVEALRETSARLRGAAHDARQGVSQRSGNPIEVYSERADAYEDQAIEADALLRELGEGA